MGRQIMFFISKEQEQNLFSYISETYTIYKCVTTKPPFTYRRTDDICESFYAFANKKHNFLGKYIAQDGKFILYRFDDDMNSLPFVEYQRSFPPDGSEPIFRLFAETSLNTKEEKKEIKEIFDFVKKWLKENAIDISNSRYF